MSPESAAEALLSEIAVDLSQQTSYWALQQKTDSLLERLKDIPNDVAVEFVLGALRIMRDRQQSALAHVLEKAASQLLRRNLAFTQDQVIEMIELSSIAHRSFPYKGILKAAESIPMTPALAGALVALRPCITEYLGGGEMRDLHSRIDILMFGPAPATSLEVQGPWSQIVFADIAGSAQKALWERIFRHAAESKSSEPSKKWLAAADALIQELGRDVFLENSIRWLALGPSPQRTGAQLSSGETEYQKGFLWFFAGHPDPRLPGLLAAYAEGALKKIPMLGAVSQKVGNACVNVLAELPGLAPVSQLSSLAQRIRYDTAQRLIEEALTCAAEKAGVSREQLEEMNISTYDLSPDGTRTDRYGEYAVRVAIEDTVSVNVRWTDAQGKILKAPPAYIKQHHAQELKDLQRTVKEMEKTLAAQRLRIETLLLTQRSITIDTLQTCYLDHPLLSDISRRLIWQFDSGPGIWFEGRVIDTTGTEIELASQKTARLWHPITSDVQSIFNWRCWLEDHGIRQPFKQAHREVYIITDAERETRLFSNRFAAHILRQHQFAALCEERGWTFRLMGQWDSHNTPTLELPQSGLRVHYDVDFPPDENAVSGHTIYLYIRTGRITFLNTSNQPQPLESVPPVVFSEAMRDGDLFTGVAGIGLDPTWGQRQPGPFRDYWNAFSFGELTEMARNRRSVLERLLPRLSIRDRCTLEARQLKVRGDRGEYLIHLNSGNILMEPDSQYLCIVEGGSTKFSVRDLPLPFEGDRVLSLILSKAFLLANDRQIKDETILRQLRPLP